MDIALKRTGAAPVSETQLQRRVRRCRTDRTREGNRCREGAIMRATEGQATERNCRLKFCPDCTALRAELMRFFS